VVLRDLAAIEAQASVFREEARESIGVLQLPLADEAVVARVALEIEPDEDLRAVLRRLHRRGLARIHFATPIDANEEPIRIFSRHWIQQLINEPVVGQIPAQRWQQPGADALARR